MPGADVPPGPGRPPGGGAPSAIEHAPTQAVDRAAFEVAPTQAIAIPSIATAPTQAVSAVPSIATAPTEAIPISSLPAPPSAPTPGAAPAPARPPSRHVAALVAAGLLVLAALAGALFVIRPHLAGLRGSSRPHPGLPGPLVGGAFASLTKEQIRARIDEGVHHVLNESTSEGVTTWTIDTVVSGVTGSVKLHHYPDVAQAEQAYQALRTSGGAAARDGKAVLHVMLPGATASAVLLSRITR